jgi:Tol biopolymer transport system component
VKTEPVAHHKKTSFRNWFIAAGLIAALAIGFFAGKRLSQTPKAATAPTASVAQLEFQRLTFQRGYLSSARFAPDGHTVIYSAAFNENPQQLYSTRIESPESRNLGLPPARILSISTSGKMAILLNPRFTAGWMITGTLAQVPIDGGSPREILQDVGEAEWSPDGKDLVVIRTRPDYQLEFPIGRVLYRATGWISNARFSPSGEQIVFVDHPALGDNRGTIRIVDLKGNQRKITNELPAAQGVHWNPAGTEVWLSSGKARSRSLTAFDLSGKQRVIYESIEEINLEDISPDGVALISSWNRRREMHGVLDGHSKESNLSWFDYSISGDISNDGKTVLFSEPGDVAAFQYLMFIRNADGSAPVNIGEGDPMGLSPDGKWALAGLYGDPFQLVLLPTGMGEKKVIAIPGLQPGGSLNTWFRDGKRFLIRRNEAGRPVRHWIYNLESAQLQPATPEGVSFYAIPAVDQNSVLACCKDGHAWIYDLVSGSSKQAPGLTQDDWPVQWSLDGRAIYTSEAGSYPLNVSLVNVDTGQRTSWKQIAPSDPAGVLSVDNLRITPDGKNYVYSTRRVLSDLFLVKGLK